jgi:hypothetical protein
MCCPPRAVVVPPPAPVLAPPTGLAVEVTRIIPASGNLTISGHQFWLGPMLAGQEVTVWADTTVVHLLRDGVRLKSVPSRFSLTQLQQLLASGGHRAGPPPIASVPPRREMAVEVDRTISACGLLSLAGRQHPVGYHLAGRRVTARLDHGVLHLLDHDRTVLRSLPNPLTPADLARLRDTRPAGPAPAPARTELRVDRRISSRGSISVAGQRIQVGISHAGRTVTVEQADTSFRVYDADQLLIDVTRTTTKTIARFKARKPEPPRR